MPALVTPARARPDTLASLRAQFPILGSTSRGKPLVYLDSAATSQKPGVVIDTLGRFYAEQNANIHRGVYQLSEAATTAWEESRRVVAHFLGGATEEVIFVRGTTEAINLVAQSFVRPRVTPSSWVLVTELEHHANIVPWQLAGARTVPVPITDRGELDLEAARTLLAQRPMLFAVTHMSNAIGTINPVHELARLAKSAGVPVLVDGAQAAPHLEIEVRSIDCDFYCFSGHKVFGPTGIGALWAKRERLESMPPYQGGGDMIDQVTFDRTTYAEIPRRFEAGTPHVAGAIGLAAALIWLGSQDRDSMGSHEAELLAVASAGLEAIPGVTLWGAAASRGPIVAFTLGRAHPHDVASLLDEAGVAVRAGHHCTQPLHRRFGLPASVRVSFAAYNNMDDVETLLRAVQHAGQVLQA